MSLCCVNEVVTAGDLFHLTAYRCLLASSGILPQPPAGGCCGHRVCNRRGHGYSIGIHTGGWTSSTKHCFRRTDAPFFNIASRWTGAGSYARMPLLLPTVRLILHSRGLQKPAACHSESLCPSLDPLLLAASPRGLLLVAYRGSCSHSSGSGRCSRNTCHGFLALVQLSSSLAGLLSGRPPTASAACCKPSA